MRTLHRLRALRRARNLDPLTVLTMVQKASQLARATGKLTEAPERLNQMGQAAQTITDSKIAERLGNTAAELTQTARWIKYAAIGGMGVALARHLL